jgi:aminoglycoside phosphotransferase (APT) family kinase protein
LSETPGLDPPRVTSWLRDHVEGIEGAVGYSLIPAGGSNLTYRVDDAAGQCWALRRPPVAAVLATAHDVEREWRIIEALGQAGDVPVAPALARCDDLEVTGAPFYVMGFVEGRILRTEQDGGALDSAAAERATDSLVDVQLAFHTVDVDAIGLGDLSRHRHGYVERQLRRWSTQVERAQTRDLALLGELHDRLARTIPAETAPPGLAHGDYRFDNTILGPDDRVAAVLDWELCTVGDPTADFAWSLGYWADPDDPLPFLPSAPTLAPAFPRRAEVARRYAERSGSPLDALPWLRVFSYWKMACIVEGVYARRRRGGQGGAPSSDLDSIASRVETLLAYADELAESVC